VLDDFGGVLVERRISSVDFTQRLRLVEVDPVLGRVERECLRRNLPR
jgi:hypothetical protein